MITRLRAFSKRVLRPIASALIKSGLSANAVTYVGLLLSFVYVILAYFHYPPLLLAVILLASSFMDALDGEVARLSGSAGPKGAFIDSSLDRAEDSLFLIGLLFLGFDPLIVAATLALSLMIPYLRARGEALGLKMEGRGLVERGERLIFIFVILVVYSFSFPASEALLYLLAVLSLVTVLQRFYAIYSSFPK